MKIELIGITGGTGSGKTFLTNEVISEYGPEMITVIQQDSYYKDISYIPLEERKSQNYDHPDSIDIDLLTTHLKQIKNGHDIRVPTYDFSKHLRMEKTIRVSPKKIIIIEGILIYFYLEIRKLFSLKVFIETPKDIRFIRRMTRDINERGRTFESVKNQYLTSVRPMHEKFIQPCKQYADIIIPGNDKNNRAFDLIKPKIEALLK